MRTVMALRAWIGAMLSAAPARSTPLVCVDLNDGVGGRFTDAGMAQRVDSNLVGDVQFDVEHEAGLAFRAMLDFHEMSVLTTHFRSGYTDYGAGGYVSRIDHVAAPATLVPLIDRYCAAGGLGRRLQVINAYERRDHLPLVLQVRVPLPTSARDEGRRLDRERMMEALLTGKNRRPVLEEVEQRFSDFGFQQRFDDDLGRAKPDYARRRIVEELKPVVERHFGRESDEEKSEDKQERIRLGEMLRERARARQCMASADEDPDYQLDLQLQIARLTYRLRRERRRLHKERIAKLVEGITTSLATGLAAPLRLRLRAWR